MNVTVVSRTDALNKLAQSLGLSLEDSHLNESSNTLIAQLIRRAVFIGAPCSIRTVRNAITTALGPLAIDGQEFEDRVAAVFEDLLAIGDILEMRREGQDSEGVILRPAPPAFVKRKDQTFILLGVAGDEITPVYDQPITYRASGLRMLASNDPIACQKGLLELGLIELPLATWLHAPAIIEAESYASAWRAKLSVMQSPQKIEELEILDMKKPAHFYKGRWRALTDADAGAYLARRPQRYGANLWCLVDVLHGLVQRLVDVHSKDARIRDCDEAWRIQAAFDAIASVPQTVNVSLNSNKSILTFRSPLPAWAIRRLSLIGERVSPQRALLSFELPLLNTEEEIRWLESMLWLARDTGENK
jgi:hypothetical protein